MASATSVSDGSAFNYFSAVCWFFGKGAQADRCGGTGAQHTPARLQRACGTPCGYAQRRLAARPADAQVLDAHSARLRRTCRAVLEPTLCAIRSFAVMLRPLWGPRAGVFDGLGGTVPIGLVSNNWGGTRVEQWIPVETSLPCGHASTGELYATRGHND